MPCKSDYLEPSGAELESRRVCIFLMYLSEKVGATPPTWVEKAAKTTYGNVVKLDDATAMLCSTCRSFTPEETERYIYDAHNKTARDLASWWERHQEWDARRVKDEHEARVKKTTKSQALKKLTPQEIEALGLSETDD